MSYTTKDVGEEIARKVTELEEHNGKRIDKRWLINAVMSAHPDINGKDAAFAQCCARYTVEQYVDRYFRTVKQAEEEATDQEPWLPGFEKLQKRYIVDRDGEQIIVPIYDMSDEEIDHKAAQHRIMGEGHFKHADELERFKGIRHQQTLRLDA